MMRVDEGQTLLLAKDIQCCWNLSLGLRIRDFVVIDDDGIDFALWDCCRGKWSVGWMKEYRGIPSEVRNGLDLAAMTPTALWGELLMLYQFENTMELRRALAEMARIRECSWAREAIGNRTLEYEKYVVKSAEKGRALYRS